KMEIAVACKRTEQFFVDGRHDIHSCCNGPLGGPTSVDGRSRPALDQRARNTEARTSVRIIIMVRWNLREDQETIMDRRDFLKGLAAMPAAALVQTPKVDQKKKPVGIQIGARSFVDEGVDKCLDTLQEKGAVNWLLPTVFTYGRGLAGRQVPGRPLPDH